MLLNKESPSTMRQSQAQDDIPEGPGGHELHSFFWLVLPVLFFIFRYAAHLLREQLPQLEALLKDELGIVENLTVIILMLALICTLSVLIRFGKSLHILLKVFLLLYCLGCIYFAGEEASWGQHWFGWQSSDFFQQHNDQGETNLHNTSDWLDRHPKGILSFLIFTGGVFVPLLFYFKAWRINYQRRWWWVWPTWVCMPSAIFTTIATWPSKIENEFGVQFYFDHAQEMKECYIAYFILLYIVSLARRLQHLHQHQEEFAPL